ncbi:hypothetical protein pb186bvf_018685 [Paramecium bursaria]
MLTLLNKFIFLKIRLLIAKVSIRIQIAERIKTYFNQ